MVINQKKKKEEFQGGKEIKAAGDRDRCEQREADTLCASLCADTCKCRQDVSKNRTQECQMSDSAQRRIYAQYGLLTETSTRW